ncbi:Ferredoxin-2 [Fundidesulfovibrio magnetotacticus]|uniref:Ferredoxin-2 n=1 Tax=Fundidesulfovibrio magnetotacticus TaxID=2730080 RepID=A0A6V8LNE2_9BACT|nr:DUF362 domain-containing protein [Fundidesulfovibrio magnetotacticus]GFK93204.1 Ferredoxin-2 [Fundidesulfovibrio magnetotacticus]
MPIVMTRAADYQDCQDAVRRAFELFPLPLAGAKVMIKPNVLRPARPEEAVTTHPAVLEAVVRCVEEHGPACVTVGDNPGLHGYGANEASFERCGLMEAARGHYRNIGQDAVEVPFAEGYGGRLQVSRAVMESDVFISVPKFKTHGLTGITGAIKNSYGILPGAQKAQLHRLAGGHERFHHVVTDVFRLRAPDLVIMDAVLGMQGNGPASKDLRWVGRVLASDSSVALDAVMARMMGIDPARLPFLVRARDLGLGSFDHADVELDGELLLLEGFRHPPLDDAAQGHADGLRRILEERALARPVVDAAACTGCGTCAAQCPAQALAMEDGLPVVDAQACIACYCCQEMCPEKAIALKAAQCPGCAGR